MDPGLYLNLFKVNFDDRPVDLMVVARSQYPQLRELRGQLRERAIEADVYAVGEQIFGYGPQQELLADFGFSSTTLHIGGVPQLATRLILEGFVTRLVSAGYTREWRRQGARVYQFSTPLLELESGVKLYRGFDLQCIYLNDPEMSTLLYVMIIDATFTYRGPNGSPLSTAEVKRRFGKHTLERLQIKQGDLAPQGKINLEVSRQRLLEQTLPFVRQHGTFILACGLSASLMHEPVRLVLSAEEESL